MLNIVEVKVVEKEYNLLEKVVVHKDHVVLAFEVGQGWCCGAGSVMMQDLVVLWCSVVWCNGAFKVEVD